MTYNRTLFEKIWESHVVAQEPDSPAVLYIDLHLVHEVTSPQAFDGLRLAGRRVKPERIPQLHRPSIIALTFESREARRQAPRSMLHAHPLSAIRHQDAAVAGQYPGGRKTEALADSSVATGETG